MNNRVCNLLFFAAGAALGSAAVYFGLKRKIESAYAQRFDAEVGEARKAYKEAIHKYTAVTEEEAEESKEEKKVYEDRVLLYEDKEIKNPIDYNAMYQGKPEKAVKDPYTISLDEFGEKEGYDSVTIYLYDDDILAYDDGDYVDDPDHLLGEGFMQKFSESYKDFAYIRNEFMERDYEILRMHCVYAASVDTTPRKIGG